MAFNLAILARFAPSLQREKLRYTTSTLQRTGTYFPLRTANMTYRSVLRVGVRLTVAVSCAMFFHVLYVISVIIVVVIMELRLTTFHAVYLPLQRNYAR